MKDFLMASVTSQLKWITTLLKQPYFIKILLFLFKVEQLKVFCPELLSKFEVSDAVPWNMFQLYKDSNHCDPHEERNGLNMNLLMERVYYILRQILVSLKLFTE